MRGADGKVSTPGRSQEFGVGLSLGLESKRSGPVSKTGLAFDLAAKISLSAGFEDNTLALSRSWCGRESSVSLSMTGWCEEARRSGCSRRRSAEDTSRCTRRSRSTSAPRCSSPRSPRTRLHHAHKHRAPSTTVRAQYSSRLQTLTLAADLYRATLS